MTGASLTSAALLGSASAGFGLVFGLAYFAALRRTADLFSAGKGYLLPAALTFCRFTGAVAVFGLAAWLGALPLLAALLGFLLARAIALRTARRTA